MSLHPSAPFRKHRHTWLAKGPVASISLAVVAAALVLVAGCGKSESESAAPQSAPGTTEISFLTMQLRPTFDIYFLDLIKEFESTHPGVKINWLDFPYQNYETKLMTYFLGPNPPDVINLPSETVRNWQEVGHILTLDDLLSSEVLGSYVPNIVDQGCRINGQLYAVPWYLTSSVVFCNAQILKEAGLDPESPPQYYDDIRAFCETIQQKTGKFGFFPLYTEAGSMRGWLTDGGVPLFNEDQTQAVFNVPRAVELVKFWTDLYKDGLVPSEALTAMHRRPIELYKAGRLALLHSGTEFLRQVKSDAPDVYDNTIIRPQLQWKGHEFHLLNFHVLGLATKSRNPKLAAEFASFVTNANNQLKFCKLTTIIPSSLEAVKDPYFTEPDASLEGQARSIAAAQVLNGSVFRMPKNSRKLLQAADEIIENICLGKITAEEGVAKTAETWNTLLAENK